MWHLCSYMYLHSTPNIPDECYSFTLLDLAWLNITDQVMTHIEVYHGQSRRSTSVIPSRQYLEAKHSTGDRAVVGNLYMHTVCQFTPLGGRDILMRMPYMVISVMRFRYTDHLPFQGYCFLPPNLIVSLKGFFAGGSAAAASLASPKLPSGVTRLDVPPVDFLLPSPPLL